MKKIIAIILSVVLCIGSLSAGYVGADIWDDDDFGTTIYFYKTTDQGAVQPGVTGDYQIGDYFYFKVQLYCTEGVISQKFVRKVNFMDEQGNYASDITDFEYKNASGNWVDATDKYRGTKNDTSPSESVQLQANDIYYRVKITNPGKYIIESSAVSENKKYSYCSTKYYKFGNGKYKANWEDEEETITAAPSSTHYIFVDGTNIGSVQDGGYFYLRIENNNPEYGFYDRDTKKVYVPGYKYTNITQDLYFDSVDDISVTKPSGASIRFEAPTGIRFKSKVVVKNLKGIDISERILKNGAVRIGTIITTKDYYTEKFDYEFERNGQENDVEDIDPDHQYHADILNPTDDWPRDASNDYIYGTCYGGLISLIYENFNRQFVASTYARLQYTYNDYEYYTYIANEEQPYAFRSVKYIAQAMKDRGYKGLTPEQIDFVEKYLE